MINWGKYSKTIVSLVAGAIGWATLVVNSDQSSISANEWIVGATYLVSALGVYAIPNANPPLTVSPPVPPSPSTYKR